MKVLVIDDEPLVRRAINRALQTRGHEVEEAKDGAEGLKMWLQSPPDLVYLDVLMPELSGPQVLENISENLADKGHSKVILISAFTGEYDMDKARSIGADLFIPKPFENIMEVVFIGEKLVDGR